MRLVFLLLLLPTVASAQNRVANLGLTGLGVEGKTLHAYQRLVENSVAELTAGNVMTPAQIDAVLLQRGLDRLRNCEGDIDCLVDVGGVLNVDLVLHGTLAQMGENFAINLRLISVHEGREHARGQKKLSGSESELIEPIHQMVLELMGKHVYRGALHIRCDRPCAAALNGVEVPVSDKPVSAIAGKHALRVTAEGREPFNAMVEVKPDEVVSISAVLKPKREPSLFEWPHFVMAGGVLSLTAGGVLGYLAAEEEARFEGAYGRAVKGAPFFEKLRDRGESYALWANVTLIVGSVLVTTGLVAWLWPEDS